MSVYTFIVVAVLVVGWIIVTLRKTTSASTRRCPKCGCDLPFASSPRCPACGEST